MKKNQTITFIVTGVDGSYPESDVKEAQDELRKEAGIKIVFCPEKDQPSYTVAQELFKGYTPPPRFRQLASLSDIRVSAPVLNGINVVGNVLKVKAFGLWGKNEKNVNTIMEELMKGLNIAVVGNMLAITALLATWPGIVFDTELVPTTGTRITIRGDEKKIVRAREKITA